ncbi:SGNH/GDSL hydrolase family protein [Sorangium sp. So ce1099]|uniref:SGNH/GDSL hydrolase family protein n=1 Tax=Sorangium sp. So ce1099 TaxID=3133331 RepID=UPI003F5EE5F3
MSMVRTDRGLCGSGERSDAELRRPRRSRWVALAGVAALVAMFSGCSDDPGGATSTSSGSGGGAASSVSSGATTSGGVTSGSSGGGVTTGSATGAGGDGGGASSTGGEGGGGAAGAGGAGGGDASGAGGAGGAGGAAGFRPCPTNGDPCKILPLGDSITDGVGVQGGGGYRIELFKKARAAGQNITFVGSLVNGPAMVDGVAFPRAHEGHSGWRINQIAGLVPTPALADHPHIVLLHAGTNDLTQNDNIPMAPQRVGAVLDKIFDSSPETLVVVAQLIPITFADPTVVTYNNALADIVETRAAAGKHVVLVDMHTGFPAAELPDRIHPNEAGYARMANVWYAAIADLLP